MDARASTSSRPWQLLTLLAIALAVVVGLVSMGSRAALADVGLSATPGFPSTVTVGDTGVAVTLTLSSSGASDEAVTLDDIYLNPSCANNNAACSGGNDPGVFDVSATGTGSAACAGVNFTISAPDSDGFVHFTPDSTVVLNPGESCVINFAVDVVGLPTVDTNAIADGTQTNQRGLVDATGNTTGLPASGIGSDQTTVLNSPSTAVSISSSADQVEAGGTVDLTVTETNDSGDGATTFSAVSVTVNDGSSDIATLVSPPDSGDTNANGQLDDGETWSWTVSGVTVNADTTFTATGTGTDQFGNVITYPDDPDEQASTSVTTVTPSTNVNASTDVEAVAVGGSVQLTVTETNDGEVDLTNPYVELSGGSISGTMTLDSTSADFSGDTNSDGILNPGETWQWLVTDSPTADATYTATGHGTDALGNDVTYCADPGSPPANTVCDAEEQATTSVSVTTPSTAVSISSSADQVEAGGTVDLTVTETNDSGDGATTFSAVSVTVNDGSSDIATLVSPPDSGDTNANGQLDDGETWSWTVSGVTVNADTTFTATGTGTDQFGNVITYPDDPDEQASTSVTTVTPSTNVNASTDVEAVAVGGSVQLTVTETNDGEVDLTNPYVELSGGSISGTMTLDSTSADFSGDTNSDGILNPGETWQWLVTDSPTADATYTATGHGTDALGNDVTYCADPGSPPANTVCDAEEQATTSVSVTTPSTAVSISSSADQVEAGGTVDLTVTETNDSGDGATTFSAVSVTVNDGSSDIATLVAPPDSGDTNANGQLDDGETWSWTVSNVTVNADTTFTATGTGTDQFGNVITYPDDPDEQASTSVTTVTPSTNVNASTDVEAVAVGGSVQLTVTETNDGEVDLTNPYVELSGGSISGTMTLDSTSADFSGDTNSDGILNPGETWQWLVTDSPTADATYTATGHGTDALGNDVTYCADPGSPPANTVCDAEEQATTSVSVTTPSTAVSISSSADQVEAGGTVDLTVTETNDSGDGATTFSAVSVTVNDGSSDIATLVAPPDSGDTNANGQLDDGETWSWTVSGVTVNADTTFTATGTGTDQFGNVITYPDDPDEQASTSVTVIVMASEWCSPGYWRNHLDAATAALEGTGYTLQSTYSEVFGSAPPLKPKATKDGASADPTLQEVLENPQYYGGDAFNTVADYLSQNHPDVNFTGERVENCPLN